MNVGVRPKAMSKAVYNRVYKILLWMGGKQFFEVEILLGVTI
jgi:hypothetical protein